MVGDGKIGKRRGKGRGEEVWCGVGWLVACGGELGPGVVGAEGLSGIGHPNEGAA